MTTTVDGGRERPPSVLPAMALSLVVLLVEVAVVVAWLRFLTIDEGWSRVVWAVLGALVLWRLLPRPGRLASRAEVLREDDAPALHRIVREVAGRVGVRPPDRLAVDTTYPVTLVPLGYRGRATLVVGLPQWTVLDPDERIAVLAHELACGRVRRGPAGCLVRLADDLLTSVRTILTPPGVTGSDRGAATRATMSMGAFGAGDELAAHAMKREAAAAVGGVGMAVVGAPARAVQRLLDRWWRPVLVEAAFGADRLAAQAAGPRATTSALLSTVGVPRGLSAADNAARTRKVDPFVALRSAGRPDRAELDRRAAAETADRVEPGHPPTAVRVRRLEAAGPDAGACPSGGVPAPGAVDPGLARAADADLAPLRDRLARRFAEELVHGRA